MKETILVIDDALPILKYIERFLSPQFNVLTFSSVEQALPSLDQATLIISDFQMPGLGGVGLIQHLRQTRMRPLLIMSALSPESPELTLVRELGIPILSKPFTPTKLLDAIQAAL